MHRTDTDCHAEFCCIYRKGGEDNVLNYKQTWTYRDKANEVKISLCRNTAFGETFHIRSQLKEYDMEDVMFKLGGMTENSGVSGLMFGKTFWVLTPVEAALPGGDGEYLLCNVPADDVERFRSGIPFCQYE